MNADGGTARTAVYGHFDCLRGRAVCGWAWIPDSPQHQVGVRVFLDGTVIVAGLAADYRPDLEHAGIADGRKSFNLHLPDEMLDGTERELVIMAEDGTVLLGTPCRVTPLDLRFEPVAPEPVKPPIELAICAIAKNEARYLLEWIAYHRVVGVEHFLVFDNDSDDGTSDMLDALDAKGVLERVPWPNRNDGAAPQHSAYAEGLRRLRERAKWIAFIDLDEFLLPLETEDVRTVLREFDDAAGLVVPWRIFGSSGEEEWRDDLVIHRFTHRAPDDHFLNRTVKTILRGHYTASTGVHTPVLTEGTLIDEHRLPAGRFGHPDHHPVPDAQRLVLNHYFDKSRAEWDAKRRKGRADTLNVRSDSDFAAHDRNEVEDLRILRFEDGIRREIVELTKL